MSCPLFNLVVIALEVDSWPFKFTPIGISLAALVTEVYLGFRQVHTIYQRDARLNRGVP